MWKFVFIASLIVGALGRTVFDPPSYDPSDPYEEYSYSIASQYCKATNNEDKTTEVKTSIKSFIECTTKLYAVDVFQRDIEEVTNSGVYSGVIKKYCAKSPQLKQCISVLIKGIAPCLPADRVGPEERSTSAVVDFVCDNDGARLESFFKNNGPECFRSQQLLVAYCQRDIQTNITSITNEYGGGAAAAITLPAKERCRIVDQGLSCMADALKDCSNPTPGHLAQEFHDVYLTTLSCKGETQNPTPVAAPETTTVASQLSGSWHGKEDIERLMKKKLELEVRTAELELWNRENELNVKHTDLTSDILKAQ